MSTEEQREYCLNKTVKNLVMATAAGMVVPIVGSVVYVTYAQIKGDNTIVGPKNYIHQLNLLIAAYNVDINRIKRKLKERKSKK